MVEIVGESGCRWSYDPNIRIGDRSGFGQVFRGTGQDGRAIAVKLVPLLADVQSERRRRQREVEINKALSVISARHVLGLLDVGYIGDDMFLIMPLADRSLSSVLKADDNDPLRMIDIIRQVVDGLIELAEVSVLHRDLKPANVLDFDGVWKLADFGISRNLLESTATYTFFGAGTLPYMAPELWDGQPATIRSELYALGILAYEALTGNRPFNGLDEVALRRQHQQESPPPIPDKVPPAVARLVLRLLAKRPIDRPQDARTVAEALDAAVKRLGPGQEALRLAALRRAQRADALTVAERRTAHGISHALSDLRHIVEEAAELAREALGAVELVSIEDGWHLKWDSSGVFVELWVHEPPTMKANMGYPVLLAGAIFLNLQPGERHQSPDELPANIVCEMRGERLQWSLVRLPWTSAGRPTRLLGRVKGVFSLMSDSFSDPARFVRGDLTADVLVDLLRQAIDRSGRGH